MKLNGLTSSREKLDLQTKTEQEKLYLMAPTVVFFGKLWRYQVITWNFSQTLSFYSRHGAMSKQFPGENFPTELTTKKTGQQQGDVWCPGQWYSPTFWRAFHCLAGRMAVPSSPLTFSPIFILPHFFFPSGIWRVMTMQELLGAFPQELRGVFHGFPCLLPSVDLWRTGCGCYPWIWARSVPKGLSSWILLSLTKTMAEVLWHPVLDPSHSRVFCSCLTSESPMYCVYPALAAMACPERDKAKADLQSWGINTLHFLMEENTSLLPERHLRINIRKQVKPVWNAITNLLKKIKGEMLLWCLHSRYVVRTQCS